MTAGLELWSISIGTKKPSPTFIMIDKSPDGRFADDVQQWNNSIVGLNAKALKIVKDATK